MRRLLSEAMGQARQSELPATIGFRARLNVAALKIVQLLAAQGKNAVALREAAQQGTEFAAAAFEAPQRGVDVAAREIGKRGGEFAPHRNRFSRRRRRGRRAQIGGVV